MKKIALFGILLSVSGVVLLTYAHFFAYSDNTQLASPILEGISAKASLPVRIVATDADIDVPVTVGGYEKGRWILSKNNALFLPTSQMPGQGGNTILYAHKRKGLFATLKDLSVNDMVTLYDLNGKTYTYAIYQKEDIKPNQMEKIQTNKENTLTLFTCDGWFDETRLVIKAFLI